MAAIIQPLSNERSLSLISCRRFAIIRWSRARETREKPMAKRSRSSHFYTSVERSARSAVASTSRPLFFPRPRQRPAILANVSQPMNNNRASDRRRSFFFPQNLSFSGYAWSQRDNTRRERKIQRRSKSYGKEKEKKRKKKNRRQF